MTQLPTVRPVSGGVYIDHTPQWLRRTLGAIATAQRDTDVDLWALLQETGEEADLAEYGPEEDRAAHDSLADDVLADLLQHIDPPDLYLNDHDAHALAARIEDAATNATTTRVFNQRRRHHHSERVVRGVSGPESAA